MIAGLTETYILPPSFDPDNNNITTHVTLPSSPTSFISFDNSVFTFRPTEKDVLKKSNEYYEIKIVLKDESPCGSLSSEEYYISVVVAS